VEDIARLVITGRHDNASRRVRRLEARLSIDVSFVNYGLLLAPDRLLLIRGQEIVLLTYFNI
jgi:hypothetical protein